MNYTIVELFIFESIWVLKIMRGAYNSHNSVVYVINCAFIHSLPYIEQGIFGVLVGDIPQV